MPKTHLGTPLTMHVLPPGHIALTTSCKIWIVVDIKMCMHIYPLQAVYYCRTAVEVCEWICCY